MDRELMLVLRDDMLGLNQAELPLGIQTLVLRC
jgi:hypothetical protein